MLSQGTKAPSQKTKGQALLAGRRRALQLVLPASQWPRRGKRDPSSNAEPRPSAARLEPDLVKDADAAGSWDRATQRLVSAATVAFFLLLLPQILKNALNMWHGDYAALAALSWVGYLTALLGNTMLLVYFLDRRESGGALVQAIGAATNVVMLTQIYAAGCMPMLVFAPVSGVCLAAAAICGAKARGALDGGKVWGAWFDFLGLLGTAAVPQALWTTFAGSTSLVPGIASVTAAAIFVFLDKRGGLPPRLQGVWQIVPSWTATVLFAFQPVAQLVRNVSDPASLAGLSVATVFMAMVSNGLMVPRALLTRDAVWLTGSSWACFTGWAQLASLFAAHAPSGERYLAPGLFAACTALYFGWNTLVLHKDARAKGLRAPFGPVGDMLTGKS